MLRHHIANLNSRIIQYHENDTVNLQSDTVNNTVNSQNDTVNELKEGLKRIYTAIRKNPEITHSQLMEIFNISESTAKRATRDLKKLGYIEREGSDKTGRWVVLK
ncbi:MAG: winged helix-turn-helix transcriptional regulator [Muribaculum sp.]|nr:winged helix-turn-helix transcriptional regulator [Muribaculum sp.]